MNIITSIYRNRNAVNAYYRISRSLPAKRITSAENLLLFCPESTVSGIVQIHILVFVNFNSVCINISVVADRFYQGNSRTGNSSHLNFKCSRFCIRSSENRIAVRTDCICILHKFFQKFINFHRHIFHIFRSIYAVCPCYGKFANTLHNPKGIGHITFAKGKLISQSCGIFLKCVYPSQIRLIAHQMTGGNRIIAQLLNFALASNLIVCAVQAAFLKTKRALCVHIIHCRTYSSHILLHQIDLAFILPACLLSYQADCPIPLRTLPQHCIRAGIL